MTKDKNIASLGILLGLVAIAFGHDMAGAIVSGFAACLFGFLSWVDVQKESEIKKLTEEIKKVSDRMSNIELAQGLRR